MAEKTKLWYLENFNLFNSLQPDSKSTLEKITSMQTFPKSQPIYFANEPSDSIFFLKKGRVKLTRTSEDGKEMIVGIVNPGEIFGEMSLIDENERVDYATAMDECLICAISKEDFKKFIEANPEINLKITKLIGFKLKKFSKRVEDLVFRNAEQRVISFLLDLSESIGKRIGSEIFIKPFFTHKEIAELTACSRQTVNSVLTGLREKKIVNFDRKKLIIKEKDKLKKLL
jgi:CRP-like cAMP-binding protein